MNGRIDLVSLGCSKNLVDSERLMKQLENYGFQLFHNSDNVTGDTVIINTCGFIGDAKEESVNMILQFAKAKNEGRIKRLYVMGCLSERYRNELTSEIPEIDKLYGKFDWDKLIPELTGNNKSCTNDRKITTPGHYSYIKISEGCDRFCAFCAIPLITGRLHSRPIDDIIDEVKQLVGKGVKEFNVIAQDLSSYGYDFSGKLLLPELIDKMAQIPGVEWIRLHYAYPAQFPFGILDVMRRHDNICKYLDIAFQHINDTVLSNMRRHVTRQETIDLIRRIRESVPDIHLRTTLMVGFPGEDEKAFNELIDFVRETKFERMGAFAYCEEDGTYAANHFTDNISQVTKDSRLDQLMAIQEQIALELNRKKIGQTLKVIIDRENPDYYVGRSQFDSPEVDPEILISKKQVLTVGEFYNVHITKAFPFELMGDIA